MSTIGIIPARYESSRYPGKPLAKILDKPMIQWVYESCNLAVDQTLVATDDDRIVNAVKSFGGNVVKTQKNHENGTSRVAEAYDLFTKMHNLTFDIIINVQGDEPMIVPEQLKELITCFDTDQVEIATLASIVKNSADLYSKSEVFLVTDLNNDALYFSRQVIPFIKNIPTDQWVNSFPYKKHVGLYAFRPAALDSFVKMPESSLEKAESLEQNRWLENGRKIRVGMTNYQSYCVDTPADLEMVTKKLQENKNL